MQREQFTNYVRTIGLFIGAALFIIMIFRSSQNASSKVAVQGKPNLWLTGQVFDSAGKYAATDAGSLLARVAAAPTPTTTQSAAASDNATAPASDQKVNGKSADKVVTAVKAAAAATTTKAPLTPPGQLKQ